jgi:hypothetical protein
MNKLRIPGFTADASLVASTKRWIAQARPNADKRGVVLQSEQFWLQYAGWPENLLQLRMAVRTAMVHLRPLESHYVSVGWDGSKFTITSQ